MSHFTDEVLIWMVSLSAEPGLGMGLYTPAQAAYLARVPVPTVTRWVHGNRQGLPVVRAQLERDESHTVTFLDLIQALAIRSIRRTRKIPLQKIRDFVDHAESKYELKYPFARKHTTYLFGDDIVLKLDDHIVQVTGKYKGQDLIRPVVELYMEDLCFTDGLASSYRPLREEARFILIDPNKRLGQPLVMPCGYSVEALIASVKAEGTVEIAAEMNRIDPADVRLAQRYEDLLAGIAI